MLDKITVSPESEPAVGSVIWLHGLGADGHDFAPIAKQLQLAGDPPLRFIFPHAPVRPVTLNAGAEMRAWFDIHEIKMDAKEDEAGIRKTLKQLKSLIAAEIEVGISADKIVIAGFSQGGAMALATMMNSNMRFAGIMGLSGYLPIAYSYKPDHKFINQNTPVFLAHGREDFVLPHTFGELTRDKLTAMGFTVDWHSYPMAHTVCAEEVQDIRAWLGKLFA